MGCNCRSGRSVSSRSPIPASRVQERATVSTCSLVESLGNNLTVVVGPGGRLSLGTPLPEGLPVASVLSGCRGPFAQATVNASVKLSSLFLSEPLRSRFLSQVPASHVKLGYLREILRNF